MPNIDNYFAPSVPTRSSTRQTVPLGGRTIEDPFQSVPGVDFSGINESLQTLGRLSGRVSPQMINAAQSEAISTNLSKTRENFADRARREGLGLNAQMAFERQLSRDAAGSQAAARRQALIDSTKIESDIIAQGIASQMDVAQIQGREREVDKLYNMNLIDRILEGVSK